MEIQRPHGIRRAIHSISTGMQANVESSSEATRARGEQLRQKSTANDGLAPMPLPVAAASPHALLDGAVPVSYTHLDVYKRQEPSSRE